MTECTNCTGTKWFWINVDTMRCAGCSLERPFSEADFDEFEAALESEYIKQKRESAKLN